MVDFSEITALGEIPTSCSWRFISLVSRTNVRRGLSVKTNNCLLFGWTTPCISFLHNITPALEPEMYDRPFWPTYQQNVRSLSVALSIEATSCTLMLLPSDSKSDRKSVV